MKLLDLLIGRKLANREGESEKITAIEGVPAMGLDGLASSAYGPEAALTMLMPLGVAGLVYMGPVMIAVLAVLAILYVSYWQTIEAYPTSGGSYTVARENLGANAGLLAATALMIDYVLNVAVGISAGVGALTSAVPLLHPYTLWLCLGVLALVTLVNLRGTFEAGLLFAIPTYLFVLSFGGGVVLYGLWQALAAGGDPTPVVPPPAAPAGIGAAVSAWLLLRAFASGCTAMTGVEAVSNGVSAFRDPTVTYAHRTLTAIVVLLGLLLAGIAYLANAYHTMAMDQTQPGYQSLLSQLSAAVWGRGALYFVAMGSVLAVLCLSANTSFAGFPRLCRQVARDEYLPRAFAIPGRRLVNSFGIVWLAVTAGILLAAFGGITDRLIPLFAVGAFLSFTLSQAGMAVHWSRQPAGDGGGRLGHRIRLAINATGAVATGASLAVILIAKFVEGAWITVLTIPCVLALLKLTKRYYTQINRQLREPGPIALGDVRPPILIVPIREWDRLAERAVQYALRLSSDVVAVHLTRLEGPDAEEHAERLRRRWHHEVETPARAAGLQPPRLVQIPSPYRSITAPLLKFVLQLRERDPGRALTVAIPDLVEAHWWDHLMHTRRVHRIRETLLRHGGPQLAVVLVPWTLAEPKPEAVIAAEEPRRAARHPERQPAK
ncbi:MAG: APC family permease [Alphaproteobacteria bacterium]|nr:APC family permease [Alphaproteobacteria bacterium]MBV9967024.1 APC family permease [Alphaproteobacteria bacterium]